MRQIMKIGVAAGLLLAAPATAQTTEYFDNIPGMSNSPGSPVPLASRLSIQYLPDGVVFSSGAGYVAVVDHVPGNPLAEPSPPNVIGGTGPTGALDYNQPITATFYYQGNLATPGVTNYVQVLGDLIAVAGTATMQAFDINGLLIGSDTEQDQMMGGLRLSVSVAGIHSIRLTETSGTIGYDNFSFNPVTLPPRAAGGVPEPTTWAMMIAGFGVVGTAMRRRKVTARLAYSG